MASERAYRVGTSSVTNGSTAVTGILTGWFNQVLPGDYITFNGGDRWHEIASVATNTSLTLELPYTGTTVSGGVYEIQRVSPKRSLTTDLNIKVRNLIDAIDEQPRVTATSLDPVEPADVGDIHFKVVSQAPTFYQRGPSAWSVGSPLNGVGVPAGGVVGQTIVRTASGTTWANRRESLSSPRTYFVRADGNNSNNGLVNNAAGAFLTPQRAMDVIGMLDLGIYNVTVSIAPGLEYGGVFLRSVVGSGTVTFLGQGATKLDTRIGFGAANAVFGNVGTYGQFIFQNLFASGSSRGFLLNGEGLFVNAINVAMRGPDGYIFVANGARCTVGGTNAAIDGSLIGFWATRRGTIFASGTILDFPNAAHQIARFMSASEQGWIDAFSMTFTNRQNVTGRRFEIAGLGGIFTNGGGPDYFPGTIAGTEALGGVYY